MKGFFYLLFAFLSACTGTSYVYKHIIPRGNLKLCFIGDTGTGFPVQRKVADLLEKERCHSIHFLGDLIYQNGLSSARDKKFKKLFLNDYYHLTRKDFHPRLYVILGNHDHRGSVKAWEEIAETYPGIIFPHPWYLVKLNKLCLAHLDTNYYKLFWKIPLGFSQKTWLREMKRSELKSCDVKLALTHQSYSGRLKDDGRNQDHVREFLGEHVIGSFDYLLSGHEHSLGDEGLENGTRILISGAGGSPDMYEDAGFLVMYWNETSKTLTHEFRRLPK